MDEQSLKRVLTTFADSPADVNLAKGQILVQVSEEIIEAKVARRDGILFIDEAGVELTAQRWIVDRIARLPVLADRLLAYVEEEPNFVTPRAEVLDELERSVAEGKVQVDDAAKSLVDLLGRDRVGTAAVVYLTADAGEGKSTVINTLARRQAIQYKRKESSWLLLPVALGGRPFLRFDDVVAASLLNRFRFPMFFDSFVELVRLGVVVPALDGFEEMFVESASGDAASALGNLMSVLQSAGSVLVAARQAYFDYKNLDTQSRLYDALAGQSVSFSSVRLCRWSGSQFVEYGAKRGIRNAQRVYDECAMQLGTDHPMLTRAVLVGRLVDLIEAGSVDSVLSQLDQSGTDYFGQLVRPIIAREALKWVDKSGEPFRPLLTEVEHVTLLETLAMEMWIVERSVVGADILEYVAELFAEGARKGAASTRQVVERIKQHALLVNRGGARGSYQFDHEEFYYYFVGRAVANRLRVGSPTDVKAALRRTSLPQLAVEAAATQLKTNAAYTRAAIENLGKVSASEPSASFVRENGGAIVARALDGVDGANSEVQGLVFPRGALDGRQFRNVRFRSCEFGETEIRSDTFAGVVFEDCRFDVIYCLDVDALKSTTLTRSQVRAAAAPESAVASYDPQEISAIVARCTGDGRKESVTGSAVRELKLDEELKHTDRVVRKFLRATEVNENVIRQATGPYANKFLREVLPELIRARVMRQVPYLGAGQQRRFRLGPSLQGVSDALKLSEGNFKRFLEIVSQSDAHGDI
jgi:hypothetical protein